MYRGARRNAHGVRRNAQPTRLQVLQLSRPSQIGIIIGFHAPAAELKRIFLDYEDGLRASVWRQYCQHIRVVSGMRKNATSYRRHTRQLYRYDNMRRCFPITQLASHLWRQSLPSRIEQVVKSLTESQFESISTHQGPVDRYFQIIPPPEALHFDGICVKKKCTFVRVQIHPGRHFFETGSSMDLDWLSPS